MPKDIIQIAAELNSLLQIQLLLLHFGKLNHEQFQIDTEKDFSL